MIADFDPAAPFASAWPHYQAQGWPCFPLPTGRKTPPPTGVTGYSGRDASYADLWTWSDDRGTGNIGLRMPAAFEADGQKWEAVALDVDHYSKGGHEKRGGDTVAHWEEQAGTPFPPTVRITSRGPGNPSGKRLYRVPAGTRLISAHGDCELIQRHHRYVVASPSRNGDDIGAVVCTFDDRTGLEVETFPRPAELPVLPDALIEVLRERAVPGAAATLPPGAAADFIAKFPPGDPCKATRNQLAKARAACHAASRHDAVRNQVLALLRLGHMGHRGVATALERLRGDFVDAVAGSRQGGSKEADREFTKFVTGERGIGLILASPTVSANYGCRCPAEISEAMLRRWFLRKDVTPYDLAALEELSDPETYARVKEQINAGAPTRQEGNN